MKQYLFSVLCVYLLCYCTSFSGINLLGPFPKGLGILTPEFCRTKKEKCVVFKYTLKVFGLHSYSRAAIISQVNDQ